MKFPIRARSLTIRGAVVLGVALIVASCGGNTEQQEASEAPEMQVIERSADSDADDRVTDLESQVQTLVDVQSDLESRVDDLESRVDGLELANGDLVDCVEAMHQALTFDGIDRDETFWVSGC